VIDRRVADLDRERLFLLVGFEIEIEALEQGVGSAGGRRR
jgi:hypothetical protein